MDREGEPAGHGEAASTHTKHTEYTEKIALIVHLIWTSYRREMARLIPDKSLTDNIATGKAQQMLDAFPQLTRPEACFLALIADIISRDDPAEDSDDGAEDGETMHLEEVEFPELPTGQAELVRGLNIDTAPRLGFREKLWRGMLAVLQRGGQKSPER